LSFAAAGTQDPSSKPEEALQLGEVRKRPIAAGETHAWRVEVPPGTSLLVTVDQHSIDLVVEAQRPAGGEPIAVHGGNDRWGPEVLLLEAAGEHRIVVRPWDASTWPGSYTIRTEAFPAPPVADAKRDALALMSRAGREALPDTPEARRQAVATYREALAAWRSLGERAWEAETLVCLAILEKESSELQPATEDFLAALALWRQTGEPRREAEALVLTVKMKANQGGQAANSPDAGNDGIALMSGGSTVPPYSAGVYAGIPRPFNPGQLASVTWNLTGAALANINANNSLSFAVQDDTSVQSATLQLSGCCLTSGGTYP
jgi:hypothetical protein